MRSRRRLLQTFTLIAATGAPVTGALAQEDSTPGGASPDVTPIAPLLGPKVSDERAPGTDSRFSMGMERSRESERPIPLRVYEQELRKLEGAKADESVRLSMEQKQAIGKIIQEHRRELRAFYAEHREEIAAIRGSSQSEMTRGQGRRGGNAPGRRGKDGAGEAGDDAKPANATGLGARRGQGGPAGAPGARAMSQEAREKMQALRAKGPQESAAISRLWETLSDDQRSHLTSRFEAIRAESMRKREAQKRGDAQDTDKPARDRLDSLTPEQRRAIRERRQAGQDAPPKRDD